ncbi:hypothetical protein RclHR1_01850015 [Rhizophagus clarus]|uniref:MIR domain-containing protein n=1 Tax=Rhizophagus clarus TaxID=94130 RepID=A0A2Z6QP45_9GLOM|nr:hypothetical protein RclHR1_01850015 [Rhizophagus clarus]GES92678.1 hypothetical protein GLOIN_2v1598945 [Rhizophagus clarus]
MEPPIYDGRIHPSEYIKKMHTYCNFRQITNEQEILKFAIMNIDSTIDIPKNITSFDALINALKGHISFVIFKNSRKRKLEVLKYVTEREGGDTANFVTEFRKLCHDAEITDLLEQKKCLFNAVPYNFLINRFTNDQKNVNSMDELVKVFEESVLEDSRIIKNGSIIALRHIATGKYLSSCDKKYPKGGGRISAIFAIFDSSKIVYCDDFGPNALWSISSNTKPIIYYGKTIQLRHEIFGKFFYTDMQKTSPISKHFRVYCNEKEKERKDHWTIKNYHHRESYDYVKSHDIIMLQWKQFDGKEHDKDIFLRSHEFEFNIGNEDYQEVVAHDQRIGGNDQWCIELIGYRDT